MEYGSKIQCPDCGEEFPAILAEIAENGTVVCPDCKKAEVSSDGMLL